MKKLAILSLFIFCYLSATSQSAIIYSGGVKGAGIVPGQILFWDGLSWSLSEKTIYELSNVLKSSAVLNFPSTSGPLPETLTVTVTGAKVGDGVQVAPSAGWPGGAWILSGYVSATDQVTVQAVNLSGVPVDLPGQSFNIIVTKF